jgi:predicted nucleic acid-binding protein
LASPTLVLLAESAQHWPTLKPLLAAGKIAGAQVHDAHIAALCLQHGVRELRSADRDFSRYPPLRVVSPVVV